VIVLAVAALMVALCARYSFLRRGSYLLGSS
jgi:hypothetical protein